MTKASIISTGNNYRFKCFMRKVRSGKQVNIVTLGGSVTEGGVAKPTTEGYAYKFAESFEFEYAGNIKFINAGLSGTPSSLGVMRYDKDIIKLLSGQMPDMLLIEYAVNDWQECTEGRAYESLIYRALTDNPECCVILVFAVTNKSWNLQESMIPFGEYYKLPMVSMKSAMMHESFDPKEYFGDEFHPSNAGHQLMSDCIMALIEKLEESAEEEPFEIPSKALKSRSFSYMINANCIDLGSFTEQDSQIQHFQVKDLPSFPDNYMHTGGNAPLMFKDVCRKVMIDYKTSSDECFGEAVISVDGNEIKIVNGYSAGGWNNSNVILALDEAEAKEHLLEIRMAEGQEDRSFTVLAVSVDTTL